MNYIEAVKAMEDGKKVKKTIWDHPRFSDGHDRYFKIIENITIDPRHGLPVSDKYIALFVDGVEQDVKYSPSVINIGKKGDYEVVECLN